MIEPMHANMRRERTAVAAVPATLRASYVQVTSWAAGGSFKNPRKDGGRDRDRTCDPYHVKVVLFR